VATWAAPLRFAPLALPVPSGATGQAAAGNARPPASAPQNTASDPPPAASPTPAPPANAGPRIAPPPNLSNQTIRMITRISLGGRRFRLRLTNAFGSAPVTIDAVHAAIQAGETKIATGSDCTVLFGGKPSVTLIPGVELISDPFALDAPNLAHLAISLFVPRDSGSPTVHGSSLHPIAYVAAGDATSAVGLQDATAFSAYYWLSGIDVVAEKSFTIVAMGDSITDANGAQEPDQGWPSLLAATLLHDKRTQLVALVNVGISGNRLLNDGADISGLGRLERHVLAQPGVQWLILLEGINDIGFSALAHTDMSSSDIVEAYRQVIAKAHAHGIKVVGCTLLPDKGAFYYREEKAPLREQVNHWIRTGGEFDAVVDLDAVMRDPSDPEQLRADFQRGDHLHPNAAGYAAMAAAFNVSLFAPPASSH